MTKRPARADRPRASARTASELQRPFFDKALELLADSGTTGLRLTPLCRSMGVTTGAFYYSFDDWRDFVVHLLDHWHAERTTRLVESALAQDDPVARLESLIEAACALPHHAEAAIRSWASTDADVARVQTHADAERYAIVDDSFIRMLGDAPLASRYTRAGVAILVGFQHEIGNHGDPAALEWSLRLVLNSARDAADMRGTRGQKRLGIDAPPQ